MKYQTMKTVLIGISALCLSVDMHVCNATLLVNKQIVEKMPVSQWRGKKVAFLGDSITDKSHVGTTKNYWQYLEEMLGIEAWVYGINGHQWSDIWEQAQRLKDEKGNNVDAIIIFAGTNDYNCGVPLGEWYSYELSNVEVSGPQIEQRVKRVPQMDESTFRGRINRVLSYLKSNFPQQQIILLTPIHRAQAHFSADNIQPEEAFPNRLGLYINDYVEVVKEKLFTMSLKGDAYYSDHTITFEENGRGYYQVDSGDPISFTWAIDEVNLTIDTVFDNPSDTTGGFSPFTNLVIVDENNLFAVAHYYGSDYDMDLVFGDRVDFRVPESVSEITSILTSNTLNYSEYTDEYWVNFNSDNTGIMHVNEYGTDYYSTFTWSVDESTLEVTVTPDDDSARYNIEEVSFASKSR